MFLIEWGVEARGCLWLGRVGEGPPGICVFVMHLCSSFWAALQPWFLMDFRYFWHSDWWISVSDLLKGRLCLWRVHSKSYRQLKIVHSNQINFLY